MLVIGVGLTIALLHRTSTTQKTVQPSTKLLYLTYAMSPIIAGVMVVDLILRLNHGSSYRQCHRVFY